MSIDYLVFQRKGREGFLIKLEGGWGRPLREELFFCGFPYLMLLLMRLSLSFSMVRFLMAVCIVIIFSNISLQSVILTITHCPIIQELFFSFFLNSVVEFGSSNIQSVQLLSAIEMS